MSKGHVNLLRIIHEYGYISSHLNQLAQPLLQDLASANALHMK